MKALCCPKITRVTTSFLSKSLPMRQRFLQSMKLLPFHDCFRMAIVPELHDSFNANRFKLAHFNGCMVRTVASTDDSLTRCLRTKTCDHNHTHVQLKGPKTPKSAFYPSKMCKCIIATIVPGYLSQSCSKHVLRTCCSRS